MSFETAQSPDVIVEPDASAPGPDLLADLLQITAQLVALREPHELALQLTQLTVERLPMVQSSMLWLYSQQHGGLQLAAAHGLDIDRAGQAIEQIRLRPGESLAGMMLQREEPLLIESRAQYRDLSGIFSPRNQAGLRLLFDSLPRELSAVLLPLRLGSETIGVLELHNTDALLTLNAAMLPLLHMFAYLAAGAIKNALLNDQMQANQHRLEAFSAISTAVSSASDLDELVGNTLDVLLGVVNASAGMLLLYNPARTSLTVGAQREIPAAYVERHAEIPVADAACAEAVRYGQPISRPLLPEEQDLIDTGLTSCIYLPLLAGGTVAGVACLYGAAPLYERIDMRALMMMSSLVGFAIANVKLYTYSEVERQRLAAVIGGIAEGVTLCDGEGRLILANQTAMNLLSLEHTPYGQQLSEMPDFYAIRRLDGDPLLVDDLPLARALAGEVFHDYRLLQRGASGRDTVMSFSGGPVNRDDTSQGAVVVFRDVTASQKAERAKDDFLAVAAHELRSPLAAVRSYTDLLVRREQKRSDEESADLRGLTILAQQVTHMLRMVDNLLDVSRIDADQVSLQLQPVNLVALIQQVIEQQRPAAADRTLLFDAQQAALTVLCDSLRIRQVLTNLISNAIRYSQNETAIAVVLTPTTASVLAARHPDFASARPAEARDPEEALALIAVEDQGAGIAEEQRLNLFRRYGRGRERRGEGLGLGLYLSKAFTVRHGGVIWVESQPGQGSTFYVALPMRAD